MMIRRPCMDCRGSGRKRYAQKQDMPVDFSAGNISDMVINIVDAYCWSCKGTGDVLIRLSEGEVG